MSNPYRAVFFPSCSFVPLPQAFYVGPEKRPGWQDPGQTSGNNFWKCCYTAGITTSCLAKDWSHWSPRTIVWHCPRPHSMALQMQIKRSIICAIPPCMCPYPHLHACRQTERQTMACQHPLLVYLSERNAKEGDIDLYEDVWGLMKLLFLRRSSAYKSPLTTHTRPHNPIENVSRQQMQHRPNESQT